MKLTDILPLEKWAELEREINKKSGLNAGVYNTDGVRITGNKTWPNKLCPVINEDSNGRSAICAPAYQNMAAEVAETGKGVCDECDAGLARIVVPIVVCGEFVGTAGGCGHLLEDGEVEAFMVEKSMGMEEAEILKLAENIDVLTESAAEELIQFIQERIDAIAKEAACEK